ncbi:MAG: hypothetical protein AUJ98_03940 [Bacteroidetes bacterium CG2_30_33_31]|nr:MAG: hypothetical protein AUJ98_03940 [Bacteroidetes bacterium CG2_30_33_31]
MFFMSYVAQSQTYLLQEGFEGATNVFTSTSEKNNNNWAVTTQLHATGLKADSAKVGLADTTYLTSPAFNTTGSQVVYLEFDQIAKMEFFDAGIIEVSNNNGVTWTQLTTGYLGAGQYINIGNKFNSTSYADWQPANNNAIPTASWWKHEKFNISSYVSNAAQVKVRFKIVDANSTGAAGNYGWLLDNIEVWKPSNQEASAASYFMPYALASGCGLGNEVVQVKIANNGSANISGGLTASFKRDGLATVTETVPNTIIPYDTITYTFTNTVNLATTADTNYKLKVWVSLVGDPNHANDTITDDSVTSRVPLVSPVISDPTIPYATSTLLHAIHSDTIIWYSDPLGQNQIQYGQYFQTPVLYDTAVYYCQAGAGGVADSISTLWTGGNGQSGNMFNVTAINTVTLDSFLISPQAAGTYTGMVYYKLGTYVGSEATSSAWTLLGSHSVVSTGSGVGNKAKLAVGNLVIPAGQTYGIYVTLTSGSVNYTTGTSIVTYTDANMTLTVGAGIAYPWAGTFSPRLFNGRIYYHAGGGSATAGACPSAMKKVTVNISGIPHNDAGLTYALPSGSVNQGVSYPIKVNLKNTGVDSLTKCKIYYSINDSVYPVYNWLGALPNDSSQLVTVANYTFGSGVYRIKAWTSMPNDSLDWANQNDTTSSFVYVCLSGAFTLGSPNSDFPTFASLQTVLDSVGICGTTVINIVPGTYNMHLLFNAVQGVSDSTTLTFQSSTANADDVILQYAATSTTNNYVVRYNNASYITLKNLTIRATGATYGYGVEMTNGSSHNTVDGCKIISDVINSSYCRPIVIYGGASNDFNTVNNCKIVGGYYGLYIYGTSSISWAKYNVISNNDISGFYIYGMMAYYQDSVQIIGNYLHDNAYNYCYGIYGYYNYNGFNISKNKIIFTPSSYAYGLFNYFSNYNNSTTAPGYCTNNMISISTGTGTNYGMYVYYASRIYVMYNTISISEGSTSSRALYQYGTTTVSNQYFKNNIFSAKGSGGYAAYYGYPSSISSSNYNDFLTDGTYLAYASANITNLAGLQSATGMEGNSVSTDPQFTSQTDLHAGAIGIFQKGHSDSVITTDIDGDLRDSIPCIGADEFLLLANDAGVSAMVSPITACPGDTSIITVKVKNFGTDTLFSATVNWSINGVVQTPASYTGTLLPGQTGNKIIGTYVFSASTFYNLDFWTTNPNGVTDLQSANDSTNISGFHTSLPAGTYTIGGSTADFPTISAATSLLNNNGICGPVVFNINPGTYNEQIVLNAILGNSSVNTITFKSTNGDSTSVILNYASTAAQPAVVSLKNVSYVTVKSLTLKATGTSSGRGIELFNGANHNFLKNCVIDLPVSTSSTYAGIYYSDASIKYNTFSNNYIKNGYYGAYSYGSSAISKGVGNVIEDNIFNGFYYYGIMSYYQDSAVINGNEIINNVASQYPRGIYSYYNGGNIKIVGNKIKLTPVNYAYGLYSYYNSASVSARGLIANNMISIVSNTTSTNYGLYCYNNNFIDIYSNSINIIGGGTSSRGLYQSSGSSLNIKNNIFSGNNYAYYIGTPSAVITSDYNCFYTTGTVLAYWNGNRANLAALKTANSKDAHSISVNPSFMTNSNLHMITSPVNDMGVVLASVPYDVDLDLRDTLTPDMGADEFNPPAQDITVFSVVEPTSPGCGLTNVTVKVKVINTGTDTIHGNLVLKYSINHGATATSGAATNILTHGDTLVYTFATQVNLTSSVDSTFHLWVWGELPQDPLGFNDTVKVNIFNGVIPPSPVTSNTTTTYSNTATLTATSSNTIFWYNSIGSTTPLGLGSSFVTPHLFGPKTFYVAALSSNGCYSAKDSSHVSISNMPLGDLGISAITVNEGCGLDSTEAITISVYNQGTGTISTGVTARYKINNNAWITPENVTASINSMATIQYTFTTPANLFAITDTMFKITAAITLASDPYHPNDTLKRDSVLSLYTPLVPTTNTPVAVTYGGNGTLTALSPDTVLWYNYDTSTVAFAGGSPLVVGPLYQTDTFYVAALAGASGAAAVGTGTVTVANTTYPSPYGQWYTGSKEQYLITAAELQAAGIPPGKIQSLAFDVVTPNAATSLGYNHQNLTIKMMNTNMTAVSSTFQTGLTQVYNVPSYQTVSGWNTHHFNTPFNWNGTSNLLIEICFDNYNAGSSYSLNAIVNQTSTSFASTVNYHSDGGGVCPYATGTTYTRRPNMKLVVQNTGCPSPKVAVIVNVSPPPLKDAAMYAVVSPVGAVTSNTATPVQVSIKNFGTDTLTSTTITYKLDGSVIANYNWTGSLPFGSISAPITVYTSTFNGGLHNLEFYVTGANGGTQAVNLNDTIKSTFTACMNGVYTIGDTTKDYQSFQGALNAVNTAGICGHVTFLVDSGTYIGKVELLPIAGMDTGNTITFRSATGDSTDVVIEYSGSSSADASTLKFNGSSYYTFQKMTIKATGSSYAYGVEMTGGAKHNAVENCRIICSVNSSSYARPVVIYGGTVNEFNTIKNNILQGGYYGMYVYGVGTASLARANIIEGNDISGFYYYGIMVYYQDSVQVIGNYVHDGTYSYNYGIYSYYNFNAFNFSKNRIIINAGSSSYGIRMYYANYYAYITSNTQPGILANNFIAMTNGSGSNYGLYMVYSNNIKVYNNSISITGGSASSFALYQSNTTSNTYGEALVNNIFSNSVGGYVAYFGSSATISNSDYNDFYTTGANLTYWNGTRANLAAHKLASSKDSHSKSVNPTFFGQADLHTSNIDLNNAAYPLLDVPYDIDGESRSLTTPDIGADEYTPPMWDAGVTYLKSPTSPVTVGSNNVYISWRNYGADTLTSVSIGWNVNGTSQTPYSWTGSLLSGNSVDSLNIGSYNFLSGANTLKLWTSNPNNHPDQLHYNDTLKVTLIGCTGQLHGTYTLGGATADFPDFASAVSALNYCGVDSHVVFLVNNGNYTEHIEIGSIYGASDTSTVTFKSVSGDSTLVSLNYTPAGTITSVLYLNGADYVTFKNMTIQSTGATNGYAILMNNSANHNKFIGNIIKVPMYASSSIRAIYSTGSSDNFNEFSYNEISGGYYAIYWAGVSTANYDKATIFSHNTIKDFYYYGCYITYQDSLMFRNNLVMEGTGTYAYYPTYFYNCNKYLEISNNNFKLHPNNYSYGLRVYYCSGTYAQHGRIFNNNVSISSGTGASYGLYIYYSKYQDISFNSVNISSGSNYSRAAYIYQGENNRSVNNNFVTSLNAYTIYYSGSSLVYSDHNNYYETGTTFGYWNGSVANLAAIQVASSMDSNSISMDPGYYSPNDLHATNPAVAVGGKPFDNISIDIDGDIRSSTNPSIGSDEFSPLQYDASVYALVQPSITYAAVTTTKVVEAVIRNFGTDSITSMNIGYKYGNNSPVIVAWTGVIPVGGSMNYTFTTPFTVQAGNLPLKVFTAYTPDLDNTNDTLYSSFTGMPLLNLTYNDNFDGPINYWAEDGNVWQHGMPAQVSLNSAHSAPNAWMTKLASNYPDAADANLYSAFFNMTNVTNATLKFWHKYKISSSDGGNVQYSTDGGLTWILLGYIGDPYATNWYTSNVGGNHFFSGQQTGWVQSTYDLTSLLTTLTTPIQFRFHFMSNASGNDEGWLVDDFSIALPQIQYDGGVAGIIEPAASSIIGNPVIVKAIVQNFGYDTLFTVPMKYKVNSGTPVSQTFNIANNGILPGDTAHLTFNTTFTAPATAYNLCVYTQISGDVYNLNDQSCKNVLVTPPPLDAGVSKILAPNDTAPLFQPNYVKVRIFNHGTTPLSSVAVQYQVNTSPAVMETWTGTALQINDSVDFTFATPYSSPVGTYQLCAKTLLLSDMNSTNDKSCKSILADGLVEELANGMRLWQNMPNPANGITTIQYEIPSGGNVHFKMINHIGESVIDLNEKNNAGIHQVKIDASKLASGIYYYSIEFDGYRLSKQMVINK